jgi:hypothetical protein
VAHQPSVYLDPVMRPPDLGGRVVEGLDPDVVRIEGEDPAGLAGGTQRSWGTITSATKHAPGSRCAAALAKTAS